MIPTLESHWESTAIITCDSIFVMSLTKPVPQLLGTCPHWESDGQRNTSQARSLFDRIWERRRLQWLFAKLWLLDLDPSKYITSIFRLKHVYPSNLTTYASTRLIDPLLLWFKQGYFLNSLLYSLFGLGGIPRRRYLHTGIGLPVGDRGMGIRR